MRGSLLALQGSTVSPLVISSRPLVGRLAPLIGTYNVAEETVKGSLGSVFLSPTSEEEIGIVIES